MNSVNKIEDILAEESRKQFDLIAGEKGLTYEKDYKAFEIGYSLGVVGTIKADIERVLKEKKNQNRVIGE